MKILLTTILILVHSIIVYSQVPNTYEDPLVTIQRQQKKFSSYLTNHEADSLLHVFTPNAELYIPGVGPVTNYGSVKDYWMSMFETELISYQMKTNQITAYFDQANDAGTYQMKLMDDSGKKILEEGHYLFIWRKIGSEWKIYLGMWNITPISNSQSMH